MFSFAFSLKHYIWEDSNNWFKSVKSTVTIDLALMNRKQIIYWKILQRRYRLTRYFNTNTLHNEIVYLQ